MITITSTFWGCTAGCPVYIFRLTNTSGAYVELINYGATLVSASIPDRDGHLGNVVLSHNSLQDYLVGQNYLGATIGRYANRIGNAEFTLDGTLYKLDDNDNGNSNHGGHIGFNAKVFNYEVLDEHIRFAVSSPDGESGFPGNVELTVDYQWTDKNELFINYQAVTDLSTPLNITNHAYFNLSAGGGDIFDHRLTILSDKIIEAEEDHIPTGLIIPAGDLKFDQNKIEEKVKRTDHTITGLNICYVLDRMQQDSAPACILTDNHSGRSLEVYTSYPGLILYTGDYLSGPTHQPFDGLCLECQFFPDSPNHPAFPSTILRPGEVYDHSIVFKFSNL